MNRLTSFVTEKSMSNIYSLQTSPDLSQKPEERSKKAVLVVVAVVVVALADLNAAGSALPALLGAVVIV